MPAPADEQAGSAWLYVVRVAVDPSVEEEWNAWYDGEHLPQILACPGFLRGSRFLSADAEGRDYMTIYAIAGPSALATPEFLAAKGWYRFSDAVEFTTAVYRPLRGEQQRES